MNFLFHIYLSKDDPEEMIGNFLGDFVKAGQEDIFSEKIKKGILLHRKIDAFSMRNSIFKNSKNRFPKEIKRYSGIAVDVIYDHFLAKHFSKVAGEDLLEFTQNFYKLLSPIEPKPGRLKDIFPFLKSENWLYRYREPEYIDFVFKRISNRFKRDSNLSHCYPIFRQNYDKFEQDFWQFLPQIEEYVKSLTVSQSSVSHSHLRL